MRVLALALGLALLVFTAPGSAGPDKVQMPAPAKRQVFLGRVDRPDVKQVREVFSSIDTIKAAKPGQMLPSGSVLTMDIYATKLDGKGEPLKDEAGRLVKDKLTAVFVMEKRAGWGAEYSEALRNGEWEYARFTADGRPGPADTTACFQCHKPKADQDYVFSMPKLSGAAR